MAIQAYINFRGHCREAVAFYAKVFEAPKLMIMAFGNNITLMVQNRDLETLTRWLMRIKAAVAMVLSPLFRANL